jgi:hypothetical protein
MTDAPAAILRRLEDDVTIPGRVDDCGFLCIRVSYEIGVGLYGTEGERDDFKHEKLQVASYEK